ncbi:MAG: hypothetical protein M1435_01755 [Actinobacteria bacterium]|nr:hypothetical protein [Actinomycetota bacterium]
MKRYQLIAVSVAVTGGAIWGGATAATASAASDSAAASTPSSSVPAATPSSSVPGASTPSALVPSAPPTTQLDLINQALGFGNATTLAQIRLTQDERDATYSSALVSCFTLHGVTVTNQTVTAKTPVGTEYVIQPTFSPATPPSATLVHECDSQATSQAYGNAETILNNFSQAEAAMFEQLSRTPAAQALSNQWAQCMNTKTHGTPILSTPHDITTWYLTASRAPSVVGSTSAQAQLVSELAALNADDSSCQASMASAISAVVNPAEETWLSNEASLVAQERSALIGSGS